MDKEASAMIRAARINMRNIAVIFSLSRPPSLIYQVQHRSATLGTAERELLS
jgi:hypothetical protein